MVKQVPEQPDPALVPAQPDPGLVPAQPDPGLEGAACGARERCWSRRSLALIA